MATEKESVRTVTPDEWAKIATEAEENGAVIDFRTYLRVDVHVPVGGGWETTRYFVKPGRSSTPAESET